MWAQMSTSSLLGIDQNSQMSRSSGRPDWFTEKDLHVGGKYPYLFLTIVGITFVDALLDYFVAIRLSICLSHCGIV